MPWTQSRYLPWGNNIFSVVKFHCGCVGLLWVSISSTIERFQAAVIALLASLTVMVSAFTHPVVYIGLQPAVELSPLFIFIHDSYSIHVYIPIAIILRYEAVFCIQCMACAWCHALHACHDDVMGLVFYDTLAWFEVFLTAYSFYVACGNTWLVESVCLP